MINPDFYLSSKYNSPLSNFGDIISYDNWPNILQSLSITWTSFVLAVAQSEGGQGGQLTTPEFWI